MANKTTETRIKCPDCGFDQTVFVKKNSSIPEVHYCDCESGGCESIFVVKPIHILYTEVFTVRHSASGHNYSEYLTEIKNAKAIEFKTES